MVEGEVNPYPIQLLVNYWELRPSLIGARLDELFRLGVNHIATFVPWQAVESDISHTLVRFLQAVADRKMTVSLILSPEVAVHYANSGLPKDIFSKPENTARNVHGGTVVVNLPPNAFALPSLTAAEFGKRYHSFLSRIDNLLADVSKSEPRLLEVVTAVLTGSFWKYYRAPQDCAHGAFDHLAGDYSGCAAVSYRQRLEQFYSQKEFAEPSPAAANRWKTRSFEEINRRWFCQHAEDVFRARSTQFIQRKASKIPVCQMELFTPEADPAFAYSSFLQALTGGNADFNRLSRLLDEAVTRDSLVGDQRTESFVHWSNMGGFRTLSDSEKQFLVLKSLLLMGGRGGGVLIDESEWFGLSQAFRARAESLARSIQSGDLKLRNRVLYFSPHLWSGAGNLWQELYNRVGVNVRMVSSIDLVLRERDANLVIVDPQCIFTHQTIQKLCGWAKGGRVVVIPRSPLFTEAARNELEQTFLHGTGMDINLGVSYRVQDLGEGKIVLYELPEGLSARQETSSSWQTFLSSLLALSGVENRCSVGDGRLRLVPLEKRGGGLGLFVMNGTLHPVTADLLFPCEVSISDLAVTFATERRPNQSAVALASRFALEVPPCGILPIAVDGIGTDQEMQERRAAALTSELMRENTIDAATSELPGFYEGTDIEATWS